MGGRSGLLQRICDCANRERKSIEREDILRPAKFTRVNLFLPVGRGWGKFFLICWVTAFLLRGRKCFFSVCRLVIPDSRLRRCPGGYAWGTWCMACRIWRAAGSKLRLTGTGRHSIPTRGRACQPPKVLQPCARIWRNDFPRWPGLRWWKRAFANTKTHPTAIFWWTAIPSMKICGLWAGGLGMDSSTARRWENTLRGVCWGLLLPSRGFRWRRKRRISGGRSIRCCQGSYVQTIVWSKASGLTHRKPRWA